MKAIKIIWLSDRLHLRKYGRTITGDEYFALKNGPVPSATRDILQCTDFLNDTAKDYASEYITEIDNFNFKSLIEPNKKVFSKSDIDVIEEIYSSYGKLDHFALSEFSHEFPEWKKYSDLLSRKICSRFNIDQLDFFINVDDGRGVFNTPENILGSIKEMYLENKSLSSQFNY